VVNGVRRELKSASNTLRGAQINASGGWGRTTAEGRPVAGGTVGIPEEGAVNCHHVALELDRFITGRTGINVPATKRSARVRQNGTR